MSRIEQPGTEPKPPNVRTVATFETTAPPMPSVGKGTDVKHHRCAWSVTAAETDYLRYHDTEWGVPVYNDRGLFEIMTLACAQSGLSWLTVLKRREDYRRAFANFDPVVIADFDRSRLARIPEDFGIVRNRAKIVAAVENARRFLDIQATFGSFATYLWSFVDGEPVQNRFRSACEIPSRTRLSEQISRDLRRRGFRYFGAKTVYSYLQAVGIVNDHLVGCFRHASVRQLAREHPFRSDFR